MLIVHLCCNNPDNGFFDGRLLKVEYEGLELIHDDWLRGCSINFLGNGRAVRISRRVFHYRDMREWVGNWCWNAISMDKKEAHRLILYLRDSGQWTCEGGPTRIYDWFNKSAKEAAC